ncbi:uncharacterized lipoprotein YehR (DUF1307 family) [Fontibacillus solani]|uniref:Uncharacterized lipoprotein YehR (DUF1307 family) n=1 Tax=Fontibacillus solani TaxID=1572857 RepID=A0A7W3XU32_9BACL|nr:hypothetical protein [Fontibacillus solani]MBA9088250.1 uncharacterized lipoprotein YehR (DUF1307 family) [Fontibacillus solani]
MVPEKFIQTGVLKLYGYNILCALVFIVLLAGCTPNEKSEFSINAEQGVESNNIDSHRDKLTVIAPADLGDIPTALEEMQSKVKLYKQAVESDSVQEATKLVGELAGFMKAVEEELKVKDSAAFEILHTDLESLITGTLTEPWDKDLLIQLDYKLYQGLRDMREAWDTK